jgi:hypothetical protein
MMNCTRVAIDWHDGLSIYASEKFLEAVGDEYGWLGGIDETGKIVCILPYTIIRKLMFRMARFRVEVIPLERELSIDEEKDFLNSVVQFLHAAGVDFIIPATTNAIFRTFPDGAIAAPYGTYHIDLNLPEEALWDNLSSSHRRKVRLAMRGGVQIRQGLEYLDIAYELVRDTLKRSGLGFMRRQAFANFVCSLGENVKVFVAEWQGVVQGCVVVPFSMHSAYYVYGGSILNSATGATNLLHWQAILEFHRLGIRRYDFVGVRINPDRGSKQEGLLMFKERFGGRLVSGYMWKFAFHPVKFACYSLAVRLQRGGDIVDYERHKMKRT